MKKMLAIMAFAVMTVAASAQGTVKMNTFDGKLFSCLYPADYEAQEQWYDNCFNAEKNDALMFDVTLNDQELTGQNLKDWGEGMKGMIERFAGEPTGWTAENPVVKGKTLTIRATKEEEIYDEEKEEDVKVMLVKVTFVVNTPQKKCFSGSLSFPLSEEAAYKTALEKMFSSFKAK